MAASYRFGSFSVDTKGYRLLKAGTPVALSPKALDLLLLFLRRPQTLVTKDDMLQALWPDVAVTDNALTQVVSELRRVLGDRPSKPTCIQTVARRGYRFVAEVEEVGEASAARPAPDDAYRAFTDGRIKLETLDPAEIPEAIAGFERALALEPRNALAHVGLAHAQFWIFQASRASHQPDIAALTRAIAHARRAIEIDGDLAEGHSALALFLMGAERPVEAVAEGRRALVLEPGNWRHQFRLGIAAWGAERLSCLEAVLAQFPQMAYASFGVAMVHIARGDLAAAQDVLARGLAVADDAALRLDRLPGRGLHWLLGMTRLARGDLAGARADFHREIESPARALYAEEFEMDAYNGLAFASLAEGKKEEALTMFEQALVRYPEHARALIGRGVALRGLGRAAEADASVVRATAATDGLRRHGRLAEAAMATSFAHVAAGNSAAAIGVLDHLLAQAPPGFAGWTMPIEPYLAALKDDAAFLAVLARLADRAR